VTFGFLDAALLLRERGGYEYVVLHLLCQALEIIGKAFLLWRNYEKYAGSLRKNLGHDLEKLVTTTHGEFGLHEPSGAFSAELKTLNELYKAHRLRYGSGFDILVDPTSMASGAILRKVRAAVRLGRRHLHPSVIRSAE